MTLYILLGIILLGLIVFIFSSLRGIQKSKSEFDNFS